MNRLPLIFLNCLFCIFWSLRETARTLIKKLADLTRICDLSSIECTSPLEHVERPWRLFLLRGARGATRERARSHSPSPSLTYL